MSINILTAGELAARLADREPRLGRTRLIALDGRSGAGKTWLAGLLAVPLDAPVIHLDDLYPGWNGPAAAGDALAARYAARIWVEAPAADRRQRLRARPDWAAYEPHTRQWAELEDQLYRAEQTRQHCDVLIENPYPGPDQDRDPTFRTTFSVQS